MTIPAGLVKLTSQAPGGELRDPLREVDHGRERPQREADAARPRGLLAQHAVPERHALVDRAALQAADADRGEDEVRTFECVVEVGGRAERHTIAVVGGLSFEHARDPLEPPGIDVMEHDIVERLPLQQRSIDERDRKPPPPMIPNFTRAGYPRSPQPRARPWGGTRMLGSSRGRDRSRCGPGWRSTRPPGGSHRRTAARRPRTRRDRAVARPAG